MHIALRIFNEIKGCVLRSFSEGGHLILLSAKVGLHKTFQLSANHVFLKSKWFAALQLFSAAPSYRSYQGWELSIEFEY
jgi:hypothetical protein